MTWRSANPLTRLDKRKKTMSRTHEGYLLIADITGYTRYLTESELEHAQETLTALLELLVENTRPPLVISRLAGDAVISYGLREDFYGPQTFLEKIEDTYVTFRKAVERLVLNNTCRCNACANIANLDLKFFLHYGTFGIQHISEHDELVGSDINLLHRLLKNRVTEELGYKAYTLCTDEALQQLGVDEPGGELMAHKESYDHLGEVQVWVQDMHPVWESKRASTIVPFPEDQVQVRLEVEIDLPKERVWEYLSRPEFRKILVLADRIEIGNRSKGRIGAGSVYQCYHGDKFVPQTILEWQPFERMIVKELSPLFPKVSILSEYRLSPTETGTRLTKKATRMRGPRLQVALLSLMTPFFKRVLQQAFEKFALEVQNDQRTHQEGLEGSTAFTKEKIQKAAASSLEGSAEGS
jgi:uncharacterized protein YndB with AHSA1/START domain